MRGSLLRLVVTNPFEIFCAASTTKIAESLVATFACYNEAGRKACRRPLGEKLYEVRSTITHGRQVRVLFIFWQGEFWLLHGFIKKTEKTPEEYLKLARKRMQSVIAQSSK